MNKSRNLKRTQQLYCSVCEDKIDGLHYGQPTCRACAAFFRRTINNKFEYKCKRQGQCKIDKSIRNACRACRFQKCMEQGMCATEVGLMSACRRMMAERAEGQQQHQFSPFNSVLLTPQSQQSIDSPSSNGSLLMASHQSPIQQQQIVQQLKHLNRMLEGYQQYSSLRKASYLTVEGFERHFLAGELPRSHIDNFKTMCKMAASLMFDMVDRSFWPFGELPFEEKEKLFTPYFMLFCNANRAYKTYKMFGPEDDRLFMPDGGYVRLSELHLFFENSKQVKEHPVTVAKVFHKSIEFLLRHVVTQMRSIGMDEMELVAFSGILLWTETPELTPETQRFCFEVRNEIIMDLHKHYQSLGIPQEEITLKTANLFLLIPKLETVVKMMREDASISEFFKMLTIEKSCMGHAVV